MEELGIEQVPPTRQMILIMQAVLSRAALFDDSAQLISQADRTGQKIRSGCRFRTEPRVFPSNGEIRTF